MGTDGNRLEGPGGDFVRTSKRHEQTGGTRPAGAAEGFIRITYQQIEEYLAYAKEKGLKKGTLEIYRRNLLRFYEDLPDEKRIDDATIERWRDQLLSEGYREATVNVGVSTVNNFLGYLNCWEFQMIQTLEVTDKLQPELTRNEYLRMLQAARRLGKEKTYFLIKTFAVMGIGLQELPLMTVEALRDGGLVRPGSRAVIHIPGCLREELLAYAERSHIQAGPIFRSRNGACMNRTRVSNNIRGICKEARVPEEKGNPRCLRKLYLTTMAGIESNISVFIEKAYARLLEEEQAGFGWKEPEAMQP